jgi:MFS family permease
MNEAERQVAPTAPFSYSALARLDPFRRLWAGDLASQSADRMAFVAITVLAYTGGGDAMGLALVIGAYFAPAIVLGVVGGLAADRVPRRTMMVAAEGARAAIAIAIGLLGQGWWLLPLVQAGGHRMPRATTGAADGERGHLREPHHRLCGRSCAGRHPGGVR